jgi:hypothetical protein
MVVALRNFLRITTFSGQDGQILVFDSCGACILLQDVAYQECEVDEAPAAPRVPYEELSRLLTHGSFAHLSAATPAGSVLA